MWAHQLIRTNQQSSVTREFQVAFVSHSVTKVIKYQGMFSSSDSLKGIIERIILPNISFREVDEMFEDDPIQFVRSSYSKVLISIQTEICY